MTYFCRLSFNTDRSVLTYTYFAGSDQYASTTAVTDCATVASYPGSRQLSARRRLSDAAVAAQRSRLVAAVIPGTIRPVAATARSGVAGEAAESAAAQPGRGATQLARPAAVAGPDVLR